MKKLFIIIPVVALLLVGLVALIRWDPQGTSAATSDNVSIQNGTQYIDLTAKAGFVPGKTIAQAGLPTVLNVSTNGTYDCSSTISIPTQNVSQLLPATGTTEISLGTPEAGVMQGTCGMGMYRFEIEFES
jgi:plastocyanin domain-containing protein